MLSAADRPEQTVLPEHRLSPRLLVETRSYKGAEPPAARAVAPACNRRAGEALGCETARGEHRRKRHRVLIDPEPDEVGGASLARDQKSDALEQAR
jgi:hypothetical protein